MELVRPLSHTRSIPLQNDVPLYCFTTSAMSVMAVHRFSSTSVRTGYHASNYQVPVNPCPFLSKHRIAYLPQAVSAT
jgi:hypothetical protein